MLDASGEVYPGSEEQGKEWVSILYSYILNIEHMTITYSKLLTKFLSLFFKDT